MHSLIFHLILLEMNLFSIFFFPTFRLRLFASYEQWQKSCSIFFLSSHFHFFAYVSAVLYLKTHNKRRIVKLLLNINEFLSWHTMQMNDFQFIILIHSFIHLTFIIIIISINGIPLEKRVFRFDYNYYYLFFLRSILSRMKNIKFKVLSMSVGDLIELNACYVCLSSISVDFR